ncbi:putative zinc finger, A20 domain containing 1 [Operophtera brumata]|uniref:Putative zinc finger, A20 domain containing 1 n=1 Tax=Operophtera brumata TaxID=104452 RepID=A0A0L7KQE5_OPEBR|nr:putative zinc finger, A20 domain containing 1 [Operophtera brumata]
MTYYCRQYAYVEGLIRRRARDIDTPTYCCVRIKAVQRVHGALKARAGGDISVISPEHSVSNLELNMPFTTPTNLVLTPAPECKFYF